MTALCGGGASSTRPGYGTIVTVSSTAIGLAINAATKTDVGDIVGALIAGVAIDLGTLCSSDPPADPMITQADITNALNVNDAAVSQAAIARLRQWFISHYWYIACQCTGTNTPAPPALSSPSGVNSNPGLPSGGLNQCWSTQTNYSVVGLTSGVQSYDLTSVVLPAGESSLAINFSGQIAPVSIVAQKIPANITALNWKTQNVGAAEPNNFTDILGYWATFDGTGKILDAESLMHGGSSAIDASTANFPLPTGSVYWGAYLESSFDTTVAGQLMNWTIEMSAVCPGSGIASPCCPPDPSIDARFNQIIGLLNQILANEGQGPYTTWTDGARHSNLGEAGSIVLSAGAVGVRAEIHAIPPNTTTNPGDPNFYWDLGFITPLALDVPLRGQRLVFNPQSFQLPQVATGVAYTLLHGTTIDLVELLPA